MEAARKLLRTFLCVCVLGSSSLCLKIYYRATVDTSDTKHTFTLSFSVHVICMAEKDFLFPL